MVSSKANLQVSPVQIALHSQKLVFKEKFRGEADPVGVSRGQTPLESEIFYHLKVFLESLVIQQSHNLLLPSGLFFEIA